MRIVIVRREPGIALSMDVYADNLRAELKKLRPGWEITEISPEPWTKGENTWRSGIGFRKYYERYWRHPRAVSTQQADLFHIIDHSDAHLAYWLKKSGSAVITTCHDLVQLVHPEILLEQSRSPIVSRAAWQYSVQGMRYADQIIAVSSNTARDITQYLKIIPEKISVVPNGVEPEFCVLPEARSQALRQQYKKQSKTIFLLNVGSNHRRKNLLSIFEVVKTLKARGMSICFWKIGEDFNVEQRAFIQSHDLTDSVFYIGKLDNTELVQYYNSADILLSPSLYEGFGLTVLEAMACGLPVITSNVSSLPEVVGDAAILVAPLDTEAMAEAVCYIHKNPIYRQQLVNRGLLRIQSFSWKIMAERVTVIYEMFLKPEQLLASVQTSC